MVGTGRRWGLAVGAALGLLLCGTGPAGAAIQPCGAGTGPLSTHQSCGGGGGGGGGGGDKPPPRTGGPLPPLPVPTPPPPPPPPATDQVTLGQTCTYAPFNNRFAFTVHADSAVTPGRSWDMSASAPFTWTSLLVNSSSPAIQGTAVSGLPQGQARVHLVAPNGLPAGTTVVLQPWGFTIPSSFGTTIALQGLGGSTSAHWSVDNPPCP